MNEDRKEPITGNIERTTSRLGSRDSRNDCPSRVLVVDDNPLNAKLVLAQLEQGGYEATAVESGEDALVALASTSYPLVLMDCELPGMDGCATTREIRRREASERHAVVVGFSSNTAASARARCLEAGMDGYIERPVTASQLITQLRRLSHRSGSAPGSDAVSRESDASLPMAAETIDANVLEELAMLPGPDGGSLLLELTAIFLRNLPAMLHDLSVAGSASSGDVTRAAHRLKSASTTIGGKRLASLCNEIEEVCRDAPSKSGPLVIEVHEEAGRLAEKLKRLPLR
jgi:two-component system, sensor histidine kinase and response regulator